MRSEGRYCSNKNVRTFFCRVWLRLSVLGLLMVIVGMASAKPIIKTDNPTEFFTNVASRLLSAQLNLDLKRIQIYPVDQYTPSVHRLLQVTANLYDATTNRTATGYPFLPSVFRPLFRSATNGDILIAGYREVQDASMVNDGTAPVMVDLESSPDRSLIPPVGTPFGTNDESEPMVYGVPLVVGAKKGYPNFNEFAMQTAVTVLRRLEFRRDLANSVINETNQMYIVGISNVVGVEFWNSYTNAFPRDLQMIVVAEVTMILTNEFGLLASNHFSLGNVTNIPANGFAGFTNPFVLQNPSFRVPLDNALTLLPLSIWRPDQVPEFISASPMFDRNAGFPVPHWWVTLRERLRCVLVDTSVLPNRIVDYVNLSRTEDTVEIAGTLMSRGGACGVVLPDGTGNPWCTNRINNSVSYMTPTYGILNQIFAGRAGRFSLSPFPYILDLSSGPTLHLAIDNFRMQFDLNPIFPEDQGKIFVRTNVFCAPLDPSTTIYLHTSWQANDPLVHYMAEDLVYQRLQYVDFASDYPPLNNLGIINKRYEPWGGSPVGDYPSTTRYDLSIKDPLVHRSDDWDFPSGEPLGTVILGRIHRGTPWQTLYLKSAAANIDLWKVWTGDPVSADAGLTLPTNDWHLISLLVHLLNKHDIYGHFSVNDPNEDEWRKVLDGLTAWTNSVPDSQVWATTPQFEMITISSDSPQAEVVAAAIESVRMSQRVPFFHDVGDILATPELSVASPWLNLSAVQLESGITDEAYEKLPSQLLPLLRADSIGSVVSSNGHAIVQFTGYDDHAYIVQGSSNLINWVPLSLNYPENGAFNFTVPANTHAQFYRSILLPCGRSSPGRSRDRERICDKMGKRRNFGSDEELQGR